MSLSDLRRSQYFRKSPWPILLSFLVRFIPPLAALAPSALGIGTLYLYVCSALIESSSSRPVATHVQNNPIQRYLPCHTLSLRLDNQPDLDLARP